MAGEGISSAVRQNAVDQSRSGIGWPATGSPLQRSSAAYASDAVDSQCTPTIISLALQPRAQPKFLRADLRRLQDQPRPAKGSHPFHLMRSRTPRVLANLALEPAAELSLARRGSARTLDR